MSFGDRLAALPTPAKVGLALGLAGFVLSLNCSQSTTENGTVTSCFYFDAGALAIAGALVWCASATGFDSGADAEERRFRRGVALALLAFAGIHALRAFGALGHGPC